ncbi:MAG: glycosyltransferase family 1 protein [Patescibacteria group bacterium]|nr:glycosyltransferase family 1 protein [Patescibacteria group bacterium]
MKIIVDANELVLEQNTGVKVYTREIINALSQIDKENEYLLYISRSARFCVPTNANIKLKILKSCFPFWTYTKFSNEVKKNRPDILFMPIQSVPFLIKPKNIKIVVTVHDLAFFLYPNHFTWKDRLLLNLHTKRAVKMADKIIVPSKATKNDLIKFYGVNQDKIHVIYHGVTPCHCDEGRRSNPETMHINSNVMTVVNSSGITIRLSCGTPRNDSGYILFVGTIQPRKNIIRLIEAFENIKNCNKKYSDLKLLIAGGKGWMAEKTYKKAQRSKVSQDIVFLGNVKDDYLSKLYKNALMFVLPSLYEGFGLTVIEAMSCGVPCIVSDNSSLSEIAGKNALLVNAHNSDDIAQKINMFLNNDVLRNDFSQKGIENSKLFNWNKCATQTLAIFENL